MSASKAPRSKSAVSARQLAANRANAARSTGPQTPEGKARSARNSRRHGFAAADFGVARLEAGLLTCCLDEAIDSQGEAFTPMVQRGNTWALFLRYQAQTERRRAPWARRAVEEFERLKTLRGDLPNEAIFEGQPEENSITSVPPKTGPIEPENAVPTSAESSAPGPGFNPGTPAFSTDSLRPAKKARECST